MIKISRGLVGGSSEKHLKWGGGIYRKKMVWVGRGVIRSFSVYFSKTFDIKIKQ